jgi:imidazolonepropionase-like amidohydrolase
MTTTRFIHARLIDGTGADPVDDTTITVRDGRIVAVDHAAPAAGDEVVDVEGRTVLPGLISAHTHFGAVTSNDGAMPPGEAAAWIFEHLRRALDLGFTTCREVGGIDGGVVGALEKGLVRGPRMIVAGPLLVQMGGHADFRPPFVADPCAYNRDIPGLYQTSYVCDGEADVRAAARLAFKRGARFLKMCASGGVTSVTDSLADTQFSVAEMRAAVEEARARHTYVTVHTLNNAGIRNGLAAGVECFEHCAELDADTAAEVKAAGAAVVPTLTVAHVYRTYTKFLPPEVVARAEGVEKGMRKNALKLAHEHGILVGAGADLIGPDQSQYGMELGLVAEEVGARQAIITTTRDNARVLRIAGEVGTVEPGKVADLIAVSVDPLDDPAALADPRNVTLVVQRGVLRKDLR